MPSVVQSTESTRTMTSSASLNGSLKLRSPESSSPTMPRKLSPSHSDPTYPTLHSPVQRTSFAFDELPDALAAFARGEFLVVMDDESRENEGDLIIAARALTTEKMAWMIRYTSGYICVGLPPERLDVLEIGPMVPVNEERMRTAYTVTVDYKHGTTTGISAHDRALTSRMLASPSATTADFARPGHTVPLRARSGGVRIRQGHTEASVDLCHLAGLPADEAGGALCELVNDIDDDVSGGMMRRDECRAFADRWGLKMISVEMLVRWREQIEGVLDSNGNGNTHEDTA